MTLLLRNDPLGDNQKDFLLLSFSKKIKRVKLSLNGKFLKFLATPSQPIDISGEIVPEGTREVTQLIDLLFSSFLLETDQVLKNKYLEYLAEFVQLHYFRSAYYFGNKRLIGYCNFLVFRTELIFGLNVPFKSHRIRDLMNYEKQCQRWP